MPFPEKPLNVLCPLPLDQEDLAFLPRLHAALVEELCKQSKSALATLTLLIVFIRVIIDEAVSQSPFLGWLFIVLAVVVASRAVWLVFLIRFPDRFPSVEGRHLGFIVGSTSTSACFVAMNIAAFPLLGPYPLGLLIACQAGISATAMVSMSASPLAYMLYMVPMLGSLILMAVIHPIPVLAQVCVLSLIAFLIVQGGVSLAVHRTLRDNFLLHLKLGDMALRDMLTGLRNRRYLQEFLEEETSRVLRSWHPDSVAKGIPPRSLTLLILDMDHFKAVNDTYGHAAGDEVLKQVASVLKKTIRQPDLVVRWGGEEFVILVLDVSRSVPLIAAQRIRDAIGSHPFRLPSGEILRKTCSIGYTQFPFLPEQPNRLNWEQVLNLADGALYQAKHSGRDRAVGIVPGSAPSHVIAEALHEVDEGLHSALASNLLSLIEAESDPPAKESHRVASG